MKKVIASSLVGIGLLALLTGCAPQGCGDLSPEDFAEAKEAESAYLEWRETSFDDFWFAESLVIYTSGAGPKVLRNPQCFDTNFVDRVTNFLND